MVIYQKAMAGTLESSDIMVMVEPCENGIEIELQSSVYQQFGENIIETIKDVAQKLGVSSVCISANDHGALDCTIRARVETALRRAGKEIR